MYQLREHFIYRILAITLVMSILVPITISTIHKLEHEHYHESCDNHYKTHLHKLEKDCDFCLFKLNKEYVSIATNYSLVKKDSFSKHQFHSYSYLYNQEYLSFSLRAPPVSIYI